MMMAWSFRQNWLRLQVVIVPIYKGEEQLATISVKSDLQLVSPSKQRVSV